MKYLLPVLLAVLPLGRFANCSAGDATWIGATPAAAPALNRAAIAEGLASKSGGIEKPSGVMILESRERTVLSDEQAERVGEFVRTGGGLLLSVGEKPGRAGMRLAFLSPTTAWAVSASKDGVRGGAGLASAEAAFFGNEAAVRGVRVPFLWELRPFHAVERGQARYDRFERPIPWGVHNSPDMKVLLPPGSDWWTRPLLNRDWQIRARADDLAGSPLLLTGRYGAGRVAVFASSVETLPDSPAAEAFWKATLGWLKPANPVAASVPAKLPPPEITAAPATHGALVTVRNPGATPLDVQIVARILTWEQAPVGDELRAVKVPAGGAVNVEIPLPKPGPTGYAALEERDAFRLRLGVLSADGATLLAETRADLDLAAPVQVDIATEELRAVAAPPFPDVPEPGQNTRMGLPVASYAYAPGQTVNATVTLANGLRNLAPLAAVEDETSPGNESLMAVNDEAASTGRKPIATEPTGWGYFESKANGQDVLRFTLPQPATLAGIVLVGTGDAYRGEASFNPRSAVVEVDGKEVARVEGLAGRFLAERGWVRISFPAVRGKVVRLSIAGELPTATLRLAEVHLEGTTAAPPPAVSGTLNVVLRDALGGAAQPVLTREISAAPLARVELPVSVALPAGRRAEFFRLDATFTPKGGAAQTSSAPVLALQPAKPLIAMSKLKPPKAPHIGLIVTRGFREFFDNAVGTKEDGGGWGQPDDLVWAYARGLKQLGPNARARADRLWVSESDMRHYSTPWRQFTNGEEFFTVGAPGLVARMQRDPRWKGADTFVLDHSDRWDTGPDIGAIYSWQDFEGFNTWLRARGDAGLTGRTRREIVAEIEGKFAGPWAAWHQERYVRSITTLRDAFAREGKRIVISAQGGPLIPNPADAAAIGESVRGMSDDWTWGMMEENAPFTTGRQMGALAFNPWLAMSSLNQWGYVSGALNNPQWHEPVSTTEPSRRAFYNRAFRGTLRPDGTYAAMNTYGYNNNAGYAFTMNAHDFNQWHRVQQRHSLLTPDSPLGAGLVLTTAHLQPVESRRFAGGGNTELPEPRIVARALQRLHEAGVGVAFSANAGLLEKWKGDAPLVLVNAENLSAPELAALQNLAARGVRIAALCGAEKVPAGLAAIFGVKADGSPAAGAKVGEVAGKPVVAQGGYLFVPLAATQLTGADARALAPLLRERLALPIAFPAGTSGYGFTSNGRGFIVVEDWLEQGRTVAVRLRAKPGAKELRAADANDHRPLTAQRDGADWLIELPLRPGDAALVAFEEL